MPTPRDVIAAAVTRALVAVLGPAGADADPLVRPTQDLRFGDYQSNVALSLARVSGRKPRELAEALVAALSLPACDLPEIAGPGFINFRLRPAWLAARVDELLQDVRLGIEPDPQPKRVVVDFSGPNLAKEMHVGHLRSTIIGDCVARILEFLGHDVLRLNHVGDWGTQFGMLVQFVHESQPHVLQHPERFQLDDLEAFYVAAKRRFDEDPDFAAAARRAVVALQQGDPTARRLWEVFCAESLRHAHRIYERLDVRIIDRGESFYNALLPVLAEDLLARGLAREDDGAVCIFVDELRNRDGGPMPLMVRKSDGGYSYDATDLAGVYHRVREERAERIIYVTDVRQRDHFMLVFAAARRAGYAPPEVILEHLGFGMVMGEDRTPFKTREGGTVKLRALLDEAELRAARVLEADDARRSTFSAEERAEIARVVGTGSVKYADLSHNPASDYVFDWDRMLSLTGNTAVYMLYAYARIRSIARRAGEVSDGGPSGEYTLPTRLEHPSEIALARQLLEFETAVHEVARELRPHVLTEYLYSLSRTFSTFYDREHGVRVLDAESAAARASRLRLCELTARVLRQGLHLLGIPVLERM